MNEEEKKELIKFLSCVILCDTKYGRTLPDWCIEYAHDRVQSLCKEFEKPTGP